MTKLHFVSVIKETIESFHENIFFILTEFIEFRNV